MDEDMNKSKKDLSRFENYFTLVPPGSGDFVRYGVEYKIPTTGVTKELSDGNGSNYKYDFGTKEVILVDVNGKEIYRKKVSPVQMFIKGWSWLSLTRREAGLVMNLSEENTMKSTYYGYINEDGDVVDMRRTSLNEGSDGVVKSMDDFLNENLNFTITDDAKIYQLNEAKLGKDSNPREGYVYWNKKHNTAYYVVAVYPDASDETKQVSYWNDEGTMLTTSIEKFKATMVPSKDVDDYDIFEEGGDMDEESSSVPESFEDVWTDYWLDDSKRDGLISKIKAISKTIRVDDQVDVLEVIVRESIDENSEKYVKKIKSILGSDWDVFVDTDEDDYYDIHCELKEGVIPKYVKVYWNKLSNKEKEEFS